MIRANFHESNPNLQALAWSKPVGPSAGAGESLPPACPDQIELSSVAGSPTDPARSSRTLAWLNALPELAGELAARMVGGPLGLVWSAASDLLTGQVRNSRFEQTLDLGCEEKARERFQLAVSRLKNPESWESLGPGWLAADFELRCADGKRKQGAPGPGDHLRIDLPDPGPAVWVQVEELQESPGSARLVVRPSPDPGSDSPHVAHLFSEQTTNTFLIEQDGTSVRASVIGEQERLNTDGGLLDRALAGTRLMGAWMGAKKPQWNSFTRKILEPAPEG